MNEKKEELKALLLHMKHHNDHHIEEMKKYQNMAVSLGMEQVAEELKSCGEWSLTISNSLQKASELMEIEEVND